ncbi:hypothetical protein IAR55_007083 [Kwoniella newhampshirensis]|uniref:Uncharacterized protein n=1 Tax=Kwoniella newhampshirensis TaxID=1651941 RepID=A0AAW0YE09_9TREE
MAPLQKVFTLIDRFVDGEVSILWSSDLKRKYTVPSCFKDIYWPRYEHRKHGKYQEYRDWEHLVDLARKAIEHGDLHPFFRIYCLFAELKKQTHHEHAPSCGFGGADPKHLDYEIGRFRLGLETLVDAIPFVGSLLVFLMSFYISWKTTSQTAAPSWLRREMLGPLGWATFFSFVVPEIGDAAASGISPNRRAARKMKHWLKLRSLLSTDKLKKLISGSWDRTARVWAHGSGEWKSELVLEGHDQAVWGVAVVEEGPKEGCYLTADRLINLWNHDGELLLRFKGSPEPVRSITMLPGGETLASACNDGVLETLRGHTDYAYMVALGLNGQLLSCGEDHTVRVWQDDEEFAVMLHPCQTVWSVSSLPNGDVVTGGSDGRVRVWSRAEDRFAEESVRITYARQVEEAMPNEDAPPIPLVYHLNFDPRTAAEEFGREHSLSDNYINQIEAFIKAHLEATGNVSS